jgi:hypothetical protein
MIEATVYVPFPQENTPLSTRARPGKDSVQAMNLKYKTVTHGGRLARQGHLSLSSGVRAAASESSCKLSRIWAWHSVQVMMLAIRLGSRGRLG